MDLLKVAENHFAVKKEYPEFKAGDTVTVHYKIIGNEKNQQYRGVCTKRRTRYRLRSPSVNVR
jgi:large subunit ribosomal protein L19